MKYGNVPGVDKPVSRIVQGTVMTPGDDEARWHDLFDAVYELGCNTFDTAHVYGAGENERSVGRWINSRGIRDKVVIVGKGAHHNADRKCVTPYDITAHLHDSLARFQTGYIDLYLLHRDDQSVPVGPIMEALNEHLSAGRIKAIGASNWTARRIADANAYAIERGMTPFVVTSPQYSLVEMLEEPWEGCISISGPQGESERAWYLDKKMAVFAWSSLAGGFLSGRLTRDNLAQHEEELYYRCYVNETNLQRLDRAREAASAKGVSVPQLALAYVLNQPLDVFALVAPVTAREFEDILPALELNLSPEELAWLDLETDVRVV
ncbi:MAG: aldo/keto reductase [Candidatus Hydrogenedentes bacterium]|nr:aldo/keto reductase [Candidatus Hydrogenedentota bacterium]